MSRIGNLTRLIHTLATVCVMTIHIYQVDTVVPIVVGVGEKRGAQKLIHGDIPQKGSTRYWSYLEDLWLCAGGLSAVNAIGTK